MMSSTENYGILRARSWLRLNLLISSRSPSHLRSHDRRGPTGFKRPNEAKQQCPTASKRTPQAAIVRRLLFREAAVIKLNQQF
jgi:hypothetical protein